MTVDDGTHIKRIFPHLDRLSQRPVLAVALYDEEPIPPPVRVSARIEQTRMPLLEQDGCSALERLEPTPPCDEKRRAELTRDILHGKAEECLELLRVVKREEATPEQMAAIAQRKVADDVQNQGEGLHTGWLAQIGTGLEFDTSKTWVPLVTRTRIMLRYTQGEELTGFSVGLAASF